MTKSHLFLTELFSNGTATNIASAGQKFLREPQTLIPFARGILDTETTSVIAQKYFVSLKEEPEIGQK